MGKYRSFSSSSGRTTLDLKSAMLAATVAREADLRKATDSSEVFAQLSEDQLQMHAKALNEYRKVGQFSMVQLPGCCGVVVSYHAQIETQFRRRGLGALMLEIRLDAAKRAGYSVILATVLESNEAESSLLEKYGFVRANSFTNQRTKNVVIFWEKVLPIEE